MAELDGPGLGRGLDITPYERAQRGLLQTQRMESLGRLAGGIAHDFNNLLTVIVGFGELASDQARQRVSDDPAAWALTVEALDAILDAARRAGDLADQLLAFARGEDSARGPLDLNDAISDLAGLLRRTLGDDVVLELDLGDAVPPVVAAASQIEQVVLNLTLNARDAMPGGGRVVIETAEASIAAGGEGGLAPPRELPPGRYVRLRVSDSGTGMTQEERERAFEPLFTTKGPGEGTGLGLATVFAIVHRSGGAIDLETELGRGTTVTILLPATS